MEPTRTQHVPTRPRRAAIRAVRVVLLCLGVLAGQCGSAAALWQHASNVGPYPPPPPAFSRPQAVAVNPTSGDVYVADSHHDRIARLSSTGAALGSWGTYGSATGQLNFPESVVVNPTNGDVYVADAGNDRVQQFTSTGTWIRTIGSFGTGNGQFAYPQGLAFDATNNRLYVTDQTRVQWFSATGTFVGSVTATCLPYGVAVNPAGGQFYVSQVGACDNVVRYNLAGTVLATFGGTGTAAGQFQDPSLMVYDTVGNQLYVAEDGGNRFQRFTATGGYVSTTASSLIRGIGVNTANGKVYTANSTGLAEGEVRVHDNATPNVQTATWSACVTGTCFYYPTGVAVSGDGSVSVANSQMSTIDRFDAAGTFLGSMGSGWGTADGQYQSVESVAVTPGGNLVATDYAGNRVQQQTTGGTFVSKFGTAGSAAGQFNTPEGVAVGSDGSIYVADSSNHRVQKFTSAGAFVWSFGAFGSAVGQLNYPASIALSVDGGTLYVADSGNDRTVAITSASGAFVRQWGVSGNGVGQFNDNEGVQVDPRDNGVMVASYGDRVCCNQPRVQKFTAAGRYLYSIAAVGRGTGMVEGPEEMAFAPGGTTMYVADSSSMRVERWTLSGQPVVSGLAQYRADGTTGIANGAWTSDGASTNVWLSMSVTDPDASESQTPYVEVVPQSGTFVGSCGDTGGGTQFAGAAVPAASAGVAVTAKVAVTGLAGATSYKWRACTLDKDNLSSGWVAYGAIPAFAVDSTAPSAPTSVTASYVSMSSISGTWTLGADAQSGVASYEACVDTSATGANCAGSAPRTWSTTGVTTGASGSLSATGLALFNGTTYYVCARAINGAGAPSVAGCSATGAATPALTLTAPSPASGAQGRRALVVQVLGTGFASGATVSFATAGISVVGTSFVTSGRIDVTIDIASSIAAGTTSNITVTNPSTSSVTRSAAFTVTAPAITVGMSTLGSSDTSRTGAGPYTVSFGALQPGATGSIGPAGSGQLTPGAAVQMSVTSDTDFVVRASAPDFTGSGGTIPAGALAWKHNGVTEAWTPFTNATSGLEAATVPSTVAYAYDLRVTVPPAQRGGTYSTTVTYTVVAAF